MTGIVPPSSTTVRCTVASALIVISVVRGELHTVLNPNTGHTVHRIEPQLSQVSRQMDCVKSILVIQVEAVVFHRQPFVEIVQHFDSQSACLGDGQLVDFLEAHPVVFVEGSKSSFIILPGHIEAGC